MVLIRTRHLASTPFKCNGPNGLVVGRVQPTIPYSVTTSGLHPPYLLRTIDALGLTMAAVVPRQKTSSSSRDPSPAFEIIPDTQSKFAISTMIGDDARTARGLTRRHRAHSNPPGLEKSSHIAVHSKQGAHRSPERATTDNRADSRAGPIVSRQSIIWDIKPSIATNFQFSANSSPGNSTPGLTTAPTVEFNSMPSHVRPELTS